MVIATVSPCKVMIVFNPLLPKTDVFLIISHAAIQPSSLLVREAGLLKFANN